MMNLPAIYITNGTAVLLLSVIHFSSKRSLRHGMLDEKMFFGMYFFNFMQCIIETITFLLDGKPAYRTLSLVLNVILFSNSAILSYFWTIYADYKLFRDIKRIRRIYPFVAIPAVFIIVGCFINLVTPVFFALDHNNVYHRANLFIVTYAVTYFYLIYGVVLIYLYREKVHKRLFLPVSLFMIPVLIGSLLQSLFYGYSFIWLGMSIGLNSLFVNLQNEASYVDELSGLFNRQYLNNLLLMYGERKNIAGFPAAIVLDIDRFKSINDRFGHTVGDDAIASAGKILNAAVGNKGVLSRYGGDEFIILMHINSQKEMTDMIDAINTQAALFNESENKPYKIEFSMGYCTYKSKLESKDEFFKRLDASMYEDKRRKIREGIIADRRQDS